MEWLLKTYWYLSELRLTTFGRQVPWSAIRKKNDASREGNGRNLSIVTQGIGARAVAQQ